MKENTNCLINYSIIIPHKNTPLLLRRCLDSIPERDDIEVIIVDDNSMNINWDDWKFNTNVSLLKTYKNKGAGFARNIGLKRAVGKWILFADSDDFFSQQFTLLLDGYRDSDYDIIYFMFTSVYSDSLLPSNRASSAIKRLKNADKSKQLDKVRYKNYAPWAKMFSHSFLQSLGVVFDETKAANDVWFSVFSAHNAKKVFLDNHVLYCVTQSKRSLEYTKNTDLLLDRFYVSWKLNENLKIWGKYEYRVNLFYYLFVSVGEKKIFLIVWKKILKDYSFFFFCFDCIIMLFKAIIFLFKK